MAYQYQYPDSPVPESANPSQDRREKQRKTKPVKKTSRLKKFGRLAVLFIAVFTTLYLALNGPALWAKIRYYYQTDIKKSTYSEYHPPEIAVSNLPSPYTTGENGREIPTTQKKEPSSNNNSQNNNTGNSANQGINVPDNQIYIPKLDIRAPIRWDIPISQAMTQLRYGVVHIKPTARPGEKGGNVFISGHSSYYYWDPGKYKHVFALLPQIRNGNKIYIRTGGQLYKYQVYQTLVVRPTDTSVMKPVNGKSILSLMTCVPIGTSLRRFIARAEQISPNPSAERRSAPPESNNLPDNLLPGIFN